MRTAKFDEAVAAVAELEQNIGDGSGRITRALGGVLRSMSEADWNESGGLVARGGELTEKLVKLTDEVDRIRRRTGSFVSAVITMRQATSDLEVGPALLTPGESVGALVTDYVTEGKKQITVAEVLEVLKKRQFALTVRNPAAVVASIMARDARLVKDPTTMGLFLVGETNKTAEQPT